MKVHVLSLLYREDVLKSQLILLFLLCFGIILLEYKDTLYKKIIPTIPKMYKRNGENVIGEK